MHRDSYVVETVGIDKRGNWHPLTPDFDGFFVPDSGPKFDFNKLFEFDVAFPVLHGPNGEDGTVQGLFRCFGVPCVGCGVLGSGIGMDKDVMKRLFDQAGIPNARWISAKAGNIPSFDEVARRLKVPFFIKPANMGSSIGIGKVKREEEYLNAIDFALRYDNKLILEEAIVGREFNIGIIGNEQLHISLPCEIIPKGELLDYKAKYLDLSAAKRLYPAPITEEEQLEMECLATDAYRATCCSGYARVDTFINEEGQVLINEINTIPGFTTLSPFPVMWEKSGLSYPDLIDTLIELAISRAHQEASLQLGAISHVSDRHGAPDEGCS